MEYTSFSSQKYNYLFQFTSEISSCICLEIYLCIEIIKKYYFVIKDIRRNFLFLLNYVEWELKRLGLQECVRIQ